jgi:glycosyltransferase involved in cell wall biosynthesis
MASGPKRILCICAVDSMAWGLLRPLLRGVKAAGFEVHLACCGSKYLGLLAAEGYIIHDISFRRTFNPLHHINPFWELYKLIRNEKFNLVNTHSPIAAFVGRLAAKAAGCDKIVYTVHGFYFHEYMNPALRFLFVGVEWLLGRFTDLFIFVSDEDRKTAIKTGIARDPSRAVTINNGVDVSEFPPRATTENPDPPAPFPKGTRVVGIVGRTVKEKGYREFLEMAREVLRQREKVGFVIVGANLESDRDQYGSQMAEFISSLHLEKHFYRPGLVDCAGRYLQMMDIFVLPSYREGFPRSILEAMSCRLPVIASDIRGCREAVVNGTTGLLVPRQNTVDLVRAVLYLLDNPEKAAEMGRAGRERVIEMYDMGALVSKYAAKIKDLFPEQS